MIARSLEFDLYNLVRYITSSLRHAASLVPVDEDIVEVEVEDEVDQLLLYALVALLALSALSKDAERVHRRSIHLCCWL